MDLEIVLVVLHDASGSEDEKFQQQFGSNSGFIDTYGQLIHVRNRAMYSLVCKEKINVLTILYVTVSF